MFQRFLITLFAWWLAGMAAVHLMNVEPSSALWWMLAGVPTVGVLLLALAAVSALATVLMLAFRGS
jgi:hypothetical protein